MRTTYDSISLRSSRPR